jgi:hypothetical protein
MMGPNQDAVSQRPSFASGCLFIFGLIVFLFAAVIVAVVVQNARGSFIALLLFLGMGLVFAAAGLGLMVVAWKLPRYAKEARLRQARHPAEPWLWREDWEQGFASGVRHPEARFVLSTLPAVLGGRLEGRLEKSGAPVAGPVEFVLSCISWRRGMRGGSSFIRWQDQCVSGSSVRIEIPYDTEPTRSDSRSLEEIYWRLNARAADGSFQASFTVPVFPTAQSDPARTRQRLEAEAGVRLSGFSPSPRRLEKLLTPEGAHYRLSSSPNRSIAFLTTVFGLAFFGIAAAFLFLFEGNRAPVLLAGSIGALLLFGSFWLWFGEITMIAARGELRITNSCLGLSRTRSVPAGEIRGFEIRPGVQQGSQVWYEVEIQLGGNRTVGCHTGIDKTEAEWFIAELRKDLGLA